MIYTRIISNKHEFKSIRKKWNALLEKSRADKIFMRWEWLCNWWLVFGNNSRLVIILIFDEDNLIGIAPFYINVQKKYPIKISMLEILGSRFVGSDYLDIIVEDGKEKIVIDELLKMLWDLKRIIINFVNIRKDSIAYQIVEKVQTKTEYRTYKYAVTTCPFIKLPYSWNELLLGFKKKKRGNVKYYRKKAIKDLSITFYRVEKEDELSFYFNSLVNLNKYRMQQKKVRSLNGTFFNNKFVEFHERISKAFLKDNILRLYFLKNKQNDVVACKYNFLLNNKVYSYQVGIKPGYEKSRLGTVLLSYCIEDAISEGCKEYDFLEGNEKYKYEWAKETALIYSYYLFTNNAFNKILFLLLILKDKLKKNLVYNKLILKIKSIL